MAELSKSDALGAAKPLVSAGAALHWLRVRSKAPRLNDWSTAPVATLEGLESSHVQGANIGIRLGEFSRTECGYLHLIDLDIRKDDLADEAMGKLREMWPGVDDALGVVQSGSGGASRHFYFIAETPYRSRKLVRSTGFSMVFDSKLGREVKKHDWEIELYGSGKQAVIPPSIHPDTDRPYQWLRPIDFDLLEFGVAPVVPTELINSWGVQQDDLGDDSDDDDLMALVKKSPLGLEPHEIDKTLRDLPDDWVEDREQWLTVGAALHHEFEGAKDGFEKWCEWASTSEKFDRRDSARVWRSFKGAPRPVRMATLLQEAGRNRLKENQGFVEDAEIVADPIDEDLADLLGTSDDNDILGPPIKAKEKPLDWYSLLQVSEDGNIKSTLPNVELIVANDPRVRGIIGFNEFTQEVVVRHAPGKISLRTKSPKPTRQLEGAIWDEPADSNGTLWTDSHDHALRLIIEAPARQGGYGIKVSDRDLTAAVDMAAHQNAFHPVRDYLMSLEWDGIPRIETLWSDYMGAEDNQYHRDTARLTLLGAVTRVFEPGHKFDFVPILEGVQGARKTTFIETLGCSWTAELEGDLHDRKAMVEKMQGAWVLEIPELQGFSRADVTTIKGLVSAPQDKVRMAYGRRAMIFKRQCIFIGSTNDEEYLRDQTGGRRFWPILCNVASIDIDRLRENLDQLWAEATHYYHQMRAEKAGGDLPLYLKDARASTQAKVLQEMRRADTVEEQLLGQIEAWLEIPIQDGSGFDDLGDEGAPIYRDHVCAREIYEEMLDGDRSRVDVRQMQQISRALRGLQGWTMVAGWTTERYGRQRVWCRGDETPTERLTGEISAWLDDQGRNSVCVAEIVEDMLGKAPDEVEHREVQQIGRALRGVKGWKYHAKGMTNRHGKRPMWTRNDPIDPLDDLL